MTKNKLPFKTWAYEEQTKMKHKVFNDYFDKWVKIVGSWSKLNYIDGFGGRGAYEDENGKIWYGSPILAAEIIKDNKKDAGLLIIDKEEENIENLKKVFEYKNLPQPVFKIADFDREINKILKGASNLAPTFFLIDPFGFSGIKYATLKRIMTSVKKPEILLTFMFNDINRFLLLEQNEKIMNDLFGTNEWKALSNLKGVERESKLTKLYRSQLKRIAKFVFPYQIEFPKMRRTYYSLFHLTNHHKGASIMKSSFAKFNYGRVKYLGVRGSQLSLFEIGALKDREIEDFLVGKYQNTSKTYLEVIEENIDETHYLESGIYGALKELEKVDKVYIERFPKLTEKKHQLRTSIEENDIIHFNTFPSITRKSLLYKTKVEYGNFTINHVSGCTHGCNYPCYARMMAQRYGKIKDYEEWLHPKIVSNALELLEKEIPRYKNKIDFVHFSFTTDPFMYDYLNRRTYPQIKELTLKIIAKLNDHRIKCTVLTKGIYPKELTDTKKYGAKNEYGITLVSLDEKFKKDFEPYSAPFNERIAALKYLHDKGLKTWVSIEPYPTPNIVKQDLSKILNIISFVDKIIFGRMNYNTYSMQFENNKDFYENCAMQVIDFCKKHKIKYHIKYGTRKHDDKSTETIFRKHVDNLNKYMKGSKRGD
ncbi:MAG: three-Cys-motif partner protein TcmP [Thermoplasmatales archaeon]|nr:three-Cys-motif partner protein TcmP [Thermoplasmatales archaeon]